MQVDLADDSLVLFNWQETDLSNPTLIKNGYSKTITLEGTNTNNEVFGHFWDLERYQQYGGSNNRSDFNPSYRVPFTLYYNGSVYERGYVKLQRVITNNGVHQYEIGLFGGLGGFFYNLSTDWSTGEKKTLADMDYVLSDGGNVHFKDLGFTINKNTVDDAWYALPYESDNNKFCYVNFAPTYNGLPDNKFDSDKVLINFSGTSLTSVSGDCRSYNGYALGKLPDKLTSEEVKDLRSYLQTPVIKVSKIFKAICNKKNNSGKYDNGYDVVLDPDFFNNKNPYYIKSWMTLNKLTFESQGEVVDDIDFGDMIPSSVYVDSTGKNYVFPINTSGKTGSVKVSMKLRVQVPNATEDWLNMVFTKRYLFGIYYYGHYQIFGIQGYTSNSQTANENVYTSSKLQWLTQRILIQGLAPESPEYMSYAKYMDLGGGEAPFFNVDNIGVTNYDNYFKKIQNGLYEFRDTIEFEVDYPSDAKFLKIRIKGLYADAVDVKRQVLATTSDIASATLYDINDNKLLALDKDIKLNLFDDSGWNSNKYVSQDVLLATSFSPAEFLINYCKMFGLYIYKDLVEDKIYISTRNNFFKKNKIHNLDDIIDTSRDIEINPTYVDTNYVSLTATGVKGECYNDYVSKYGKVYGQKIVDTGYEFNADTKELIENEYFKNAIQVRDRSQYYFKKLNGLNPYIYNGFSYNLYKNGDYSSDSITIDIPKKEISTSFEPLYEDAYYDVMSKAQFEDVRHKGINTEGVFLFLTGYQDVTGLGYYLTDDTSYMAFLNNNPCWIMTNTDTNFAHQITTIPRFSRYLEGNNWMVYSWDYGSPRELYVPEMVNNDDVNLYSLYFKKYYTDLYDINTKVLTCYIKSDNLTEDSLRNIYWFRNGLWRLNKVIDYNPQTPDTTKCEFIKIQDLDDLSNDDPTTDRKIKITLDRYDIGQSGGTIIGTVITSDNYGWDISGITYDPSSPLPRGLVTISPQTYGQSGNFTVTVPSNIRDDREVTITVKSDYNDIFASASTSFTQPGVEYTFDVQPLSFSGGTLQYSKTLNITNPYYYDWTIQSKPNWVTVVPSSITNGQYGETGDTAVTVTAAKNTTEVERRGTITLKETTYNHTYTVSIWQDGYKFSVPTSELNFAKNGESKTLTITNPYGYTWKVQGKPSWISVTPSSNSTGTSLTITASKNIVFERSGSVVIYESDFGHTYTIPVVQESGYVFSIDPTIFNFDESESSSDLTITNPNQMDWTITNIPAWITISPTAGTGSAVTVTAAENIGFERSGLSITVNETLCDQHYTFDVVQESGYYFELLPVSGLSFTSANTSQNMTINCKAYNWMIISKPSWVTTNYTTGNGYTVVSVTAASNTGFERSGNIKVKDLDYNLEYTLSVSQASGYVFSVSPSGLTFNSAGTEQQMTITNPNGYDWYVGALASWLSASPTSGNSSGTITFTATPNGREERVDNFEIVEDTYDQIYDCVATQASGYTFKVSTDYLDFDVRSGSSTFTITNPDGYAWTITNIPAWMTLSATAGTSSATITVTVTANDRSENERYQSIQINENDYGRTFEVLVSQEGYMFYVDPDSLSFTSAGTTGQTFKVIVITDEANLGWKITNIPNWITLSATAGTGTTDITVRAQNNAGNLERSSVFVVTEKTFNKTYNVTVSQESGYSFEVSPLSFSFVGTGESKTLTITNPYGYNWEIEELPYWITVSQISGNSNASVTVTASSNNTGSNRSGTFTVYETTLDNFIEISVSQEFVKLTPSWTSFTAELL